jgi:hypothetical protein
MFVPITHCFASCKYSNHFSNYNFVYLEEYTAI